VSLFSVHAMVLRHGRDYLGLGEMSHQSRRSFAIFCSVLPFKPRTGHVCTVHLITFGVYICHCRLCVCLSVLHRIRTLLHRRGCNLGNGRGCPLVVNYWEDLQSLRGFRCYDNIAPNAKCQRVLVLPVCLFNFAFFTYSELA